MNIFFRFFLSCVIAFVALIITAMVMLVLFPMTTGPYVSLDKPVVAPALVLLSDSSTTPILVRADLCEGSAVSYCIRKDDHLAIITAKNNVTAMGGLKVLSVSTMQLLSGDFLQVVNYTSGLGGGRVSIYQIKNREISVLYDSVNPSFFITGPTEKYGLAWFCGFSIVVFLACFLFLIKATKITIRMPFKKAASS
jgi:hypothetical protein